MYPDSGEPPSHRVLPSVGEELNQHYSNCALAGLDLVGGGGGGCGGCSCM